MRFRLTIARLLLLVGLVAVGSVALLTPSSMWLGVVALMSAAIFLGGIVAAIYLDGPARAFWLGVVIFGLGYRALDLGAGIPSRHSFVARWDQNYQIASGWIDPGREDRDRLSRHLVDSIGFRGRVAPLEVGEVVQAQSRWARLPNNATVLDIKPDQIEVKFGEEIPLAAEALPLGKIHRSDVAQGRVYRIGEYLFSWIFGLFGGILACRLHGRGLAHGEAPAGDPGGS